MNLIFLMFVKLLWIVSKVYMNLNRTQIEPLLGSFTLHTTQCNFALIKSEKWIILKYQPQAASNIYHLKQYPNVLKYWDT